MNEQNKSIIDSVNTIYHNHDKSNKLTKNEKNVIISKANAILEKIKSATSQTAIEALVNTMLQLQEIADGEIPELTGIINTINSAKDDRIKDLNNNVSTAVNQNITINDNQDTLQHSLDFEVLHKKNEKFKTSIDEFNTFLTEGIKIDKDGNVEEFEQVLSDIKMHSQKFNEYDYETLNKDIEHRQSTLLKDLQELDELQKQMDDIKKHNQEEEQKKKEGILQYLQESLNALKIIDNNQDNKPKKHTIESKEYKALVSKKEQKKASVNKQLSELSVLTKDKHDIKVKTKKLTDNLNVVNTQIQNTKHRKDLDIYVRDIEKKAQTINGVSLKESNKLEIPEFKETTIDDLYELMNDQHANSSSSKLVDTKSALNSVDSKILKQDKEAKKIVQNLKKQNHFQSDGKTTTPVKPSPTPSAGDAKSRNQNNKKSANNKTNPGDKGQSR